MKRTWKIWATLALALLTMITWSTLGSRGSAPQITRAVFASAPQTHLDKNVSLLSQPRLSPAFLNKVLAAYHSPAQGLGQQIYELGRQAGVNSDLLAALFGHESLFGTTGEARISKSVGNLRCLDRSYATYRPSCADGYAQFAHWIDGIGASYRLLKVGYIDGLVTIPLVGHRCTTLAQVIVVWAPTSDGNAPDAYIQDVLTFLSAWYDGRVKP